VKVHAGGNSFNGVLNIGVRPTVNSNNRRSVEVYILNFEKEIYDEKISVELLSYLREEKKFGSIDELKQEIQNDIVKAKNWFLD
jgi:riboflavin kinase/FMN adenylyltransferase